MIRTTRRTIGVPIELMHGPSPWRAVMPFGEKETDAWRFAPPTETPEQVQADQEAESDDQ